MPSNADILARSLQTAGIEYVFGVPGSLSSVELIDAAARVGIRYVLCSNESSAAVMAGTYGSLRNRPGVVSTGVGPGAVAAVAGVANCFLERVPVLVLTDRYAEAEFRRLPRQRLEQDQLFRPITKATLELSPGLVAATIERALTIAVSGRQGPVHVDLPYDVMLAEATEAEPPPAPLSQRFTATAGSDHPGLRAAAEAIERAQRPAVIAGLQIARAGAAAETAFQAFAERLNVPVLASLAAKGTLPEHHPLAAGTFRGAASERALLDAADLIVLVGFDAVEIFTPGVWHYAVPVVSIDEAPFLEGPYRPSIEVVASLADALPVLTGLVSPHSGWNREDVDAYRRAREQGLQPSRGGLQPGAVIRITRERLPDTGVLTVDAGQHKVVTSDLWQARRPRGFFSSSGLGSMAVALPAALAVKLVEPATPVVCFTGDGGFLMRAGDLETAVRERLPVVVVVFNDRTLNLIKLQQDRRGYSHLGTDFADCDFAAVARGFGFDAERVADEASLDAALSRALASGRPWLIDALIDPEGYG